MAQPPPHLIYYCTKAIFIPRKSEFYSTIFKISIYNYRYKGIRYQILAVFIYFRSAITVTKGSDSKNKNNIKSKL